MKPRVFIASPLFNPAQHAIIDRIEDLLKSAGFEFYSARRHSGSDKMTPEQRKDLRAWDPVFDSNVSGLDDCRVMIAVLEYAMPEGQSLKMHFPYEEAEDELGRPYNEGKDPITLELPDAGTVWEMGYHRAQGKTVVGFHTDKAKHLNLMLSHGVDGMLRGFGALADFLGDNAAQLPSKLVQRAQKMRSLNPDIIQDASFFDWSSVEQFDAASKEVE